MQFKTAKKMALSHMAKAEVNTKLIISDPKIHTKLNNQLGVHKANYFGNTNGSVVLAG